MDDIRLANDRKGLFFLGEKRTLAVRLAPPLRVGFVYDTPLKTFSPF